jgi:anti-sigma B factor antagonist
MSFAQPVIVFNLPEKLTADTGDCFVAEVEAMLDGKRPLLVFDFSEVRHFDSGGIAALLNCLEEVLKRNGDLKLAVLPAESIALLEMTGVDRLFEIFDDASEAANSFYEIRGDQRGGATATFDQAGRFAAGTEMSV